MSFNNAGAAAATSARDSLGICQIWIHFGGGSETMQGVVFLRVRHILLSCEEVTEGQGFVVWTMLSSLLRSDV